MGKPDIGTMTVDGELYTMIGVAEFQHVIREIPYSVELFVKKIHENTISRDVLIQRTPDQWANKAKSRLIESVLKNYQIGVILTACGRSENMTDDELLMLDACSVPHYIAGLKYYNSICEKGGNPENKSYLDFFREFIKSEEFTTFTAYKAVKNSNGQKGSKSGSGGTQYSFESVDDRQYCIDSFIEEFLNVTSEIAIEANKENTDDTKIVDETHTPNITQIKNTDFIDAEFNDNYTDTDDTDNTNNQLTMEFVEAVLNSD